MEKVKMWIKSDKRFIDGSLALVDNLKYLLEELWRVSCEAIIKKELEFADLVNADNQDEILKELQEVYRKAKAFDAIRKIEIQSDITGYYDDTESYMHDVESVIEKYLEDKQND
ncbi:hypothetical protein [Staphylococcus gallinarum]|uniref:hypothetical protein n=1 Tax=Staphylococcus gallinarum TaxID=1293 RepID=UPI000D1D110B|nr:hypothetical protein [Staphylococcus gallinarum]PTE79284.1 hypothetical protein BUY96_02360 [Staphylococcus gallinarum]